MLLQKRCCGLDTRSICKQCRFVAQLTPVCDDQRVQGMIKRRRGRTVKRLRQLACSVQESQAPHKDKAKWVASEQLQATASAFKRS